MCIMISATLLLSIKLQETVVVFYNDQKFHVLLVAVLLLPWDQTF